MDLRVPAVIWTVAGRCNGQVAPALLPLPAALLHYLSSSQAPVMPLLYASIAKVITFAAIDAARLHAFSHGAHARR
jgi:hypothetical protein